jgi:cell division protein FtsB
MNTSNRQQRKWMMAAAALVVLVAVGTLARGLWRQIRRLQELAAAEAELAPLIVHEEEQNQQLLDQLDRVSSPEYAEEWARVDAGMTLPDEVQVVVSLEEEPDEPVPPTPPPPPPSPWRDLWRRLFGDN